MSVAENIEMVSLNIIELTQVRLLDYIYIDKKSSILFYNHLFMKVQSLSDFV